MRQPLTYSICAKGLLCPRAMYWRYEKGYEEIQSEAQLIGTAFHAGLEARDPVAAVEIIEKAPVLDQADHDKNLILMYTVRSMVIGALKYWQMDWVESHKEIKFEIPLRNPETGYPSRKFYLAGKIDEITKDNDGNWGLNEYKTSAQGLSRDLIEKLPVDSQLSLYFDAAEQLLDISIDIVRYRLARKPSIRQRQTETVGEYGARLLNDYQNRPEFYFHELIVPRSRDDILRSRKNLWAIGKLFHFCQSNDIWPMNTGACSHWGRTCAYLPLCTEEEGAEYLFTVTGSRTPELEE